MPVFDYKAKKGPKEVVSGSVTADSADQAVDKISALGLIAVTVVPAQKGPDPQAPARRVPQGSFLSPVRLKPQAIDTFTRQLASMIKANVDLLRALSLISRQTQNNLLRAVVTDIEQQVREGKMLSESLARYPGLFNNLYVWLVRSGEKAGMLDSVLYRLAEYREKEQEIRQKVQAALAYPILIAVVGSVTIFVMLTYFLPKISGMFVGLNQELPLPTKILLGISSRLAAHWYWILIAAVLFIALLGRGKKGAKMKFVFDQIKLHLPLLRDFIRTAEVAKFTRTLSALLKNGVSVYESLDLAANTVDNQALKERLLMVKQEIVTRGSTLSFSLQKVDIFPAFAVNMIAVGEEGGKLDESLNEITRVYEREIDQTIKIITSLMEPLFILVIGGVVGFIVLALLMPIFNMGDISM